MPTQQASIELDAAGRLTRQVACLACGYNLRLQPLTGMCPECGLAVERSARGESLCHSDPQWVARVREGANWLGLACVQWAAMTTVFSLNTHGTRHGFPWMTLLYLCIASTGLWRFTESEPGLATKRPWAKLARWGIVGGVAMAFAPMAMGFTHNVDFLALWHAQWGFLPSFLAALEHARGLGARLPKRRFSVAALLAIAGYVVFGAMVGLNLVEKLHGPYVMVAEPTHAAWVIGLFASFHGAVSWLRLAGAMDRTTSAANAQETSAK